jgi:hypothetical protein
VTVIEVDRLNVGQTGRELADAQIRETAITAIRSYSSYHPGILSLRCLGAPFVTACANALVTQMCRTGGRR